MASLAKVYSVFNFAAVCLLVLLASTFSVSSQSDGTTVFVEELRDLCGSNASASVRQVSGCKLWLLCDSGVANGPTCDPAHLLATACLDVSNSGPCAKIEGFCNEPSNAEDCGAYRPLDAVLTTKEAYTDAQSICTDHTMDGCQYCAATKNTSASDGILAACPDPLGTLSYMCLSMAMNKCERWAGMCVSSGMTETFASLCTKAVDPASSAPPTGQFESEAPAPAETAQAPTPSLVTPLPAPAPSPSSEPCLNSSAASQPACMDYVYPENKTLEDIKMLCGDMPNMVGCTFQRSCKQSKSATGACTPFSILGDLCTDMPSMKGCENWVALCGSSSSVVEQCKQSPPLAHVMTTKAATDAVLGMCESHSMQGCEQCTDPYKNCPDPMKTLSTLCWGMSGMAACTPFYTMCQGSAADDLHDICEATSSGNGIPPMTMWFHQRVQEVILFKAWIPRSTPAYIASWVACFFMAVAAQGFKALRSLVEIQWVHRDKDELLCHCGDEEYAKKMSQIRIFMDLGALKRNLVRMLFTGVTVTLEYWLMLVAMIFNIGLFVAVVTGYMLGALLFGHIGEAAHAYLSRLPKTTGSDRLGVSGHDYAAPVLPAATDGCHSHCV